MNHNSFDNRVLLEAVKQASSILGFTYTELSDGWVVVLERDNIRHYIYGCRFDNNSQASASIATDKVAAHLVLEQAGVKSVPHYLLTNQNSSEIDHDLINHHFSHHDSLVVKPTHGSKGMKVQRVHNSDHVLTHIASGSGTSWAVSPYKEVNKETRVIISAGVVQLAYEKTDPVVVDNLKMFNLSLGAKPKLIGNNDLDTSMVNLAVNGMKAIGLDTGAVDIITCEDGEQSILEINSAFSLENFANSSEDAYAQTINFYTELLERIFNQI